MRGDIKALLALFVVLTLGATYAITDSWFDYTDAFGEWEDTIGDTLTHNFWLANGTDWSDTLEYNATSEQVYLDEVFTDDAATIPTEGPTTVDEQVGADADDGRSHATGGYDNVLNALIGTTGDSSDWDSWFRFTTVAIPNGAIITTAYITIVPFGPDNDGAQLTNIAANDIDDAVAPTTQAIHAALARTTAQVAWDNVDFTVPTPTNSPDIAQVIQEVVARTGWAGGNDLMILWDNDGSPTGEWANVQVHDAVPGDAVRLHVEYTTNPIGTDSDSGPHSINLPTSIASGDLLWVSFTTKSPASSALHSVACSGGWTKKIEIPIAVPENDADGDDHILTVCTRLAAGGDSLTVTVTGSTDDRLTAIATRITNHSVTDVVTDISVSTTVVTTDGVAPDPGALSGLASRNYMWITGASGNNEFGNRINGCPSGYSALLLNRPLSGMGAKVLGECQRVNTATSEDPGIFTVENAGGWIRAISYVAAIPPITTLVGYETDGNFRWTDATWNLPANQHLVNYTITFGNSSWPNYLRVSAFVAPDWTVYSFALDTSPFTEDMGNITDVEQMRVEFRHPGGDTARTPFLANLTVVYDLIDDPEPTWDGTAAGAWAGLLAVCGAFAFVWLSIRDKGKPLKSAKKFFKKGRFKL